MNLLQDNYPTTLDSLLPWLAKELKSRGLLGHAYTHPFLCFHSPERYSD